MGSTDEAVVVFFCSVRVRPTDELLPVLAELGGTAVIVMDNAPYHELHRDPVLNVRRPTRSGE